MSSDTENLEQAGQYCPGCGYDLRGLSSGRCPECGLGIDQIKGGLIVWEDRHVIGVWRAFMRTLLAGTFGPVRMARATAGPMDVQSALLFRRIVRLMILVPTISLFVFLVCANGGIEKLKLVDGESRVFDPWWEPEFVWQAGATLWPVLPISFMIVVILGTGIMHWLRPSHRGPIVQNRAMAFSCYLIAPLGWLFIPCGGIGLMNLLNRFGAGDFEKGGPISTGLILAVLISFIFIGVALLNSLRAIAVATQRGTFKTMLRGVGILLQAAASAAIGFWLFPMLVGIWRLAIGSLLR